MLKNISFRDKSNIHKGFIVLLTIIFADSLCNGISRVILPVILNNLGGKSAWLGAIIGIQSLLGIIIFLPQATFIKKVGEKISVRISIFINIIVYLLYLFNQPAFIATGKFVEGLADRLMNSSASKVIYDQTDGKNNRGRMRAYMEAISSIGVVIGPAIAAVIMGFSIKASIIIAAIVLTASFIFSNGLSDNTIETDKTKISVIEKNESLIQKYYIGHLQKYFKNKFIVAITVPSILISCLDIFYSVILNLYLLKTKNFNYINIATLWSAISIIDILLQIPSGHLADKKKHISFYMCAIFNIIGFIILLSSTNSIFILVISVILINIGCTIYTTAMSALFGDLTSKENRLSESESYRMIRAIGEGLLTISLSFIFDINSKLSLIIIASLVVIGTLITQLVNSLYKKFNIEK